MAFAGSAGSPPDGSGVSPFSKNGSLGALSVLVEPNSRCQKPDFFSGAGSGIGASTGGGAVAAMTVVFGAAAAGLAGVAAAVCTGAGLAGAGADAGAAARVCLVENAGRDVATLEIFGGGFTSGAGADGFALAAFAAAALAKDCSRLPAMALTSSQLAGRGVSARYARKCSSADLLSRKYCWFTVARFNRAGAKSGRACAAAAKNCAASRGLPRWMRARPRPL